MYDCGVLHFTFCPRSQDAGTHAEAHAHDVTYTRIHNLTLALSPASPYVLPFRNLTADDSTRSLTLQIFLYIEYIVYEGYVFYIQRNEL